MGDVLPPNEIGEATVLVIVVNFRTPQLTAECLASLAAQRREVPRLRVVVVENGSGDGSAERLAEEVERVGWGNWAEVVISERNLGFAGGNNLGFAHRRGEDYVLLLNSDTRVKPGCLAHCLGVMGRNPGIGVLSCRLDGPDGEPQNVCRKLPTPLRAITSTFGLPWLAPRLFGWADTEDLGWDRRTEARDAGWVGGAFMLMRRELPEAIGLLDPGFFFYGEDIEFCWRVRRAGLRVRYDPGASILHWGGGSSDPSRLARRLRSAHQWQSRYLVQRRCWGRGAAAAVRVADLLAWGLRAVRLRRRGADEARAVLALLLTRLTPSGLGLRPEAGT